MTRFLQGVLAVSLAIHLQSCSWLAPSFQRVLIEPSDSRAHIYVDGEHKGKGSVALELRRNRDHAVVAREGTRVGQAMTYREISTTGVLDLIGGVFFIVPFLGAFAPGFYYLVPEHVFVPLPPASQRKVEPGQRELLTPKDDD